MTSSTAESLAAEAGKAAVPLPCPPSEIQGNIVKYFGRQYATYLFVRFTGDPAAVRQGLKSVLKKFVTSHERQTELYRKQKSGGPNAEVDCFGMFGISGHGAKYLDVLQSVSPDPTGDRKPFEQGLQKWQDYTWHQDQEGWQPEYLAGPVDCFLLLANDNRDVLNGAVAEAAHAIAHFGAVAATEDGYRLKHGPREFEHFGFPEASAQPLDPVQVLIQEAASPGSKPGFGCFATYLKLEQNVKAFRKKSGEFEPVAKGLSARRIRELAVGRTYSGDLLTTKQYPLKGDGSYAGVPAGVCPLHAHARVMRHGSGEPPWLILRRSVSYGIERPDIADPDDETDLPETGSGLLFLALQRTIWDVITLMGRATRRGDPMLVRSDHLSDAAGQSWILPDGRTQQFPMADLTAIRGGEYFFIPSMLFIDRLA